MGAFRVPIEIGAPSGSEFETVDAVVDTGATYTTLPGSVLTRLGIAPYRRRTFAFADGRRREGVVESRGGVGLGGNDGVPVAALVGGVV